MRENLQKSGGDLLIRIGKPEEIVPELVAKYKIDTLFFHSEDARDEQQDLGIYSRRGLSETDD